ncbi:MAG: hypothetical protein H6594_01465 [Flavobacteriales bacterium]|nr:hypothetical protein [Flavobacteriales bacterium]
MQLTIPELTYVPEAEVLAKPDGYRGLYAFHKYWGKKPAEPIRYLIEHLTPEGGLVVDPFMGSGIAAIEAVNVGRRVVGIDINPAAIRITKLLVSPPPANAVADALRLVKREVMDRIQESYGTAGGASATHYLWADGRMTKVWLAGARGRTRIEADPTDHDLELFDQFEGYEPHALRQPRFFNNPRINSSATLSLHDLFSGRALRNIDLIMDAITELPEAYQEAMRLSLTASIGQMSKMVFAISGRGKMTGAVSEKVEVGSWVIGFWRPAQHFEVNVWNCFERRVLKLVKALNGLTAGRATIAMGNLDEINAGLVECSLVNGNTLDHLPALNEGGVDLFITDPPHSDRIPYLELSELWNMVLGETPDFASEIVVSNAKDREKSERAYNADMSRFLEIATTKLSEHGSLVLFFNARSASSWEFFDGFRAKASDAGMNFQGCFPLVYSAGSVVQDSREGALKTDYGLVFSRAHEAGDRLTQIPGWMSDLPARD